MTDPRSIDIGRFAPLHWRGVDAEFSAALDTFFGWTYFRHRVACVTSYPSGHGFAGYVITMEDDHHDSMTIVVEVGGVPYADLTRVHVRWFHDSRFKTTTTADRRRRRKDEVFYDAARALIARAKVVAS